MKKSFMNNIKHFVDSNVRQRIDRASNNNNDFFGDDLLLVERQFEDIRHVCSETNKRISAMLQSINSPSHIGAYTQNVQASLNNLSNITGPSNSSATCNTEPTQHASSGFRSIATTTTRADSQSNSTEPATNHSASNQAQPTSLSDTQTNLSLHRKLPIVGFLKFLTKSRNRLRPDSLLSSTLGHCSQLQAQLTELFLNYEHLIDLQCLKPIQQILDVDIPNVVKLRKLFIKSHNDLEHTRTKYTYASQKQQVQAGHFTTTSYTITQTSAQQANASKLDQLKKEFEEAVSRFEQARDTYATELYAFVCRETELVNLFIKFYEHQADYQQQVGNAIQSSMPSLGNLLANTPRKVVFGTALDENLRITGRSVSLVIELSVHLLYANALNEEGLFRIPGSSVKIKKLKSAINAWFVTLASQAELEVEQQRNSLSSISAIYNLFKEIASQRPTQTAALDGDNNTSQPTTINRDDATLTQSNLSSKSHDQQLVFDVHAIAGLLKLYLRSLPEPLFTHALYDQWIEASVKATNDEQSLALEQVIKQLPKANLDNLRHLIRFLHLLTCHREFNKMTATNLAITMAPSLIWARPGSQHYQAEQPAITGERTQHDEMVALNLQMSTVGISTSLHALVIENLICNAEKLLPGTIEYTIPNLKDISECDNIRSSKIKHARSVKSTSPTGLSTASSSSFSSNSNVSLSSDKKHSRKGGSMDGLLKTTDTGKSGYNDTSRPISVQIQHGYPSQSQQPPPIPPAPVSRSHPRRTSELSSISSIRPQKPPAPPLPGQTCNPEHQKPVQIDSTASDYSSLASTSSPSKDGKAPNSTQSVSCAPMSLRGTGTTAPLSIKSLNVGTASSATRPSVPPPSRPDDATRDSPSVEMPDQRFKLDESSDSSSRHSDNRSSHSLDSSGILRADFEEVNQNDLDDIDISVLVSPVASFDSISGDDSSFDNDCRSLDHSWTECRSESNTHPAKRSQQPQESGTSDEGMRKADAAALPESHIERAHGSQDEVSETKDADDLRNDYDTKRVDQTLEEGCEISKPPVKPLRNVTPKVTQSTPL